MARLRLRFFASLVNLVKSKTGFGLKAWRTLLVYTSVTPCLMHDSRSRKGTVFVPKHGKKTCKGTVLYIAKAHFRHSLGTILARFRHKYSTLGTFLKIL